LDIPEQIRLGSGDLNNNQGKRQGSTKSGGAVTSMQSAINFTDEKPSQTTRFNWRAILIIAALVFIAGSIFGLGKLTGWIGNRTAPFEKFEITRFAPQRDLSSAELSPDGKSVAYVGYESNGKSNIRLKQVNGEGDAVITKRFCSKKSGNRRPVASLS
jgi:Tol biopolymer transport system component